VISTAFGVVKMLQRHSMHLGRQALISQQPFSIVEYDLGLTSKTILKISSFLLRSAN